MILLSVSFTLAQRYETLVNQGRSLTPAVAEQNEKALNANPSNVSLRAGLIGYYSFRALQDPAAREARLRHIDWLIHNDPASFLLRNPVARLQTSDFVSSTASLLESFRSAWRDQVNRYSTDPVVIENAAQSTGSLELNIDNGARWIEYLKRLRVLEPGDPEWALDLAGIYGLAITQGMAPGAPPDKKRFADATVTELQSSTDAALVGWTGLSLYEGVRRLSSQARTAQGVDALAAVAESLLRRASSVNPRNPNWAAEINAPALSLGTRLSSIVQVSDLWPGGVVPAIPVPAGGTRLSASEESAKRPRLILDTVPANLTANCSVRFNALLGTDGRIKTLQIIGFESLSIPFVGAERDALRQSQYPPVVVNEKPIEAVTEIEVKCPPQVVGGIPSAVVGIAGAPPPPPPPPPPSPTPGRGPIPLGTDVQAGKLLFHPNPAYPPLARAARVEGVVVLQAIIAKDGTIRDLRVISQSSPLLLTGVVDTVKMWRYKETILNGEAVEVITTISVNFSLGRNPANEVPVESTPPNK